MSSLQTRLIASVLFLLFAFLQFRLWYERGGLWEMWKLKKQIAVQQVENNHIRKLNGELLSQVRRSQNNRDAAELRARNELGMVKKGETFYQIVEK